MPVQVPGNFKITVKAENTKTLSNLDMEIKIVRESFLNIPIPCLVNIGSCRYNDLCTLLDRMEKENWAGVSAKLSKQVKEIITKYTPWDPNNLCPITPRTLDISIPVELNALPQVISTFATGDYAVKVKLFAHNTNTTLGCFDFKFSLDKPCTG